METGTFYIDAFNELSETEKKKGKIKGILAATIENKRKDLGLSQSAFAAKVGLPENVIAKIEKCEYNMTFDEFIELFDKLGIPFSISIDNIVRV